MATELPQDVVFYYRVKKGDRDNFCFQTIGIRTASNFLKPDLRENVWMALRGRTGIKAEIHPCPSGEKFRVRIEFPAVGERRVERYTSWEPRTARGALEHAYHRLVFERDKQWPRRDLSRWNVPA